MKTLLYSAAAVVALCLMTSSDAQAGKLSYSYGFGPSYSSYGGSTYFTTFPRHRRLSTHVVYPSPVWHDAGHLHYVPSSVSLSPFGLRYNPGGYVWRQSRFDRVYGVGRYLSP